MDEPAIEDHTVNFRNNTCRRCGACCQVDMIAYVCSGDMERWEKEGRQDIISRIRGNDVMWFGGRIVDKSGVVVTKCTFLKWDSQLALCEIYDTRPMVCRDFVPGSSELCPLYYELRKG